MSNEIHTAWFGAAARVVPGGTVPGSARAGKVLWLLQRLRGMGAAEITHRLHERIKREISERRNYDWADFDVGDGPLPALPVTAPAEEMVDALLPELEQRSQAFAAGETELMGQHWPQRRSSADWHLDPVTGEHWPKDMFCFKVPFRHDRRFGDPKYMWELNRLQQLQPVAALAHLRDDDALRAQLLAEIESWMDANRPFNGLSWATGVEVALRTVSLLAVFSCLDGEALTPELRQRMRACLAAHGYWLARFPSRHSSANNHLIAEAAALFLLGTLWPDLPDAADYACYGRKTLVEEVFLQIHDDGVGAEQSPTYTAFVLEWFLLCLHVAEQADAPFPEDVRERLAAAGAHLRWITDEGGHQPRIGDDDEGRVLSSGLYEPGYVSSVLGCMAAFLGRRDLTPPGVQPTLRNLYFGQAKSGREGPLGRRSFDRGGYTVIRHEIAGRKTMLAMDHGPLGHLSIAAHGHADALALWLHVDDMPVLVDAGTFLYHAGGVWRDAFRGTPAHNTLCLDGRNSSRLAGSFNWGARAKAFRLPGRKHGGPDTVTGRHDGYRRSHGVLHERRITAHEHGYTVRDRLTGRLRRHAAAEIAYHVHPDLDVSMDKDTVTVRLSDGRPLLRLRAGEELECRIESGEVDPPRGWYSPRFGEKIAATRVVFHGDAATDREFVTELEML